jgi:hypothetical protein
VNAIYQYHFGVKKFILQITSSIGAQLAPTLDIPQKSYTQVLFLMFVIFEYLVAHNTFTCQKKKEKSLIVKVRNYAIFSGMMTRVKSRIFDHEKKKNHLD